MFRIPIPRLPHVALLLVLIVGSVVAAGGSVSAHATLRASDPAAGSLQPVPPDSISLDFTLPVDLGKSFVAVYDQDRRQVDRADLSVDESSTHRLRLSLEPLVDGVYTVVWRVVGDDDHEMSGTFNFRVGQSRVPGATEVSGETPALTAILLRWLTFLGLTYTIGWLLFTVLGQEANLGWQRAAAAGTAVAVLAQLGLILVHAWLPGQDIARQAPLGLAADQHPSWYVQLVLSALVAGLLFLVRPSVARRLAPAGLGLAALAVLMMAFTSHAAVRADYRWPAIAIDALHLLAVATWVGGLAQLALRWRVAGIDRRVAGRFSRIAVVLAPLAIVSGAVGAGFALPALDALWTTGYGRLLLIKSVIVAAVLILAWFNRLGIRRMFDHLRSGPHQRTLRAETTVALIAILVGSTLALSATPSPGAEQPVHLRVALDGQRFAHLELTEPGGGRSDVRVWLSGTDNDAILPARWAAVSFSMVERAVDLTSQLAAREDDGRMRAEDVPLTIDGWWRASVRFETDDPEPPTAEFLLLVPDPTFAVPERDRSGEPAAVDLFKQTIAGITELRSLRVDESLTDGLGNSVTTQYAYAAPDRSSYVSATGTESVTIGDTQYYRAAGEAWTRRQRPSPMVFPEGLPAFYAGAEGHTLGRQEVYNGELCQLLSFYVPAGPGRDEAWYLWWIGLESGRIMREGMVANHHYMTSRYFDHDAAVLIEEPSLSVR